MQVLGAEGVSQMCIRACIGIGLRVGLSRFLIFVNKLPLFAHTSMHMLTARRHRQELCLRKSLASLAAVRSSSEACTGGVPFGGAGGKAASVAGDLEMENDDVYACNQSQSPDAGDEGGEGHYEEEQEEGEEGWEQESARVEGTIGGGNLDASKPARIAAVVDATAARWAEMKALSSCQKAPSSCQSSHLAECHKNEQHEGSHEVSHEEGAAGTGTGANRADARVSEDEALATSINSSLGSSLGSKSRGGRLGMLSVSLDASGVLQLPDTPQITSGGSGHGDPAFTHFTFL